MMYLRAALAAAVIAVGGFATLAGFTIRYTEDPALPAVLFLVVAALTFYLAVAVAKKLQSLEQKDFTEMET
jgi:hypothetical protein